MIRKIAVLTGTRAEYGILKPLLERIRESNELELKLLVTGLHLLEKYGLTINEIKGDGFYIDAEIPMYRGDEAKPTYHGEGLGFGIEGCTGALNQIRPDILVVSCDRLEGLAATLAAAALGIPIAHIHGGDKIDSGHIDEPIRHSMTKFAHIHFPATEESARRLIKMGEEPWRVFKVGALGLDSVFNQQPIPRAELAERLRLGSDERTIVCVFHPVQLEKESAGKQMRQILDAIKALKIQTVIIYPNNDAGSEEIIREIEKSRQLPFIRIFPNLTHREYVSLYRYADVLLGNSSSGIIEAPSLKLPMVHVGSRNTGREHADNVIYVSADKEKIMKAIDVALNDREFRERVNRCVNPYGDGKSSQRIVKVLTEIEINERLLLKRLTY